MSILKLFTMSETDLINLLEYHETRISEFRLSNIFTLIDLFCENCSFSNYDYSIAMNENFKDLVYHHFVKDDIETSFLKSINEITVNMVEKTGKNRHVDFGETGKVIDSVTYEEIEGTPVQIGEHFYSTESTNKLIENEDVFDPFTRQSLSSSEVDDLSSKIYLSSIKAMNPHSSENTCLLSSDENDCVKEIIFDDEQTETPFFDRMFHELHDKEDFLWCTDRSQTTLSFTSPFYDAVENYESISNCDIRPNTLFSQEHSLSDPFVSPRSAVREYRMGNNI